MSRVNGATGALSIGPSAGYTLFFVFMHVSLLFTAYASSYTHMHIHVITYIALIIWIKLKLKMPNFLTGMQRMGALVDCSSVLTLEKNREARGQK